MIRSFLAVDAPSEFVKALKQRAHNVERAVDLDEALAFVSNMLFDLVLVFVQDKLTRELREFCGKVHLPIVILGQQGSSAAVEIAMLNSGADDFLRRPIDIDLFEARVEAALRGYESRTQNGVQFGDFTLDTVAERLFYGSEIVKLTYGELRVLLILATRAGRVVSREMLLDLIYGGRDEPIGNKILDVRVVHIRNKLRSYSGRGDWIETISGRGWVFHKKLLHAEERRIKSRWSVKTSKTIEL